MVQSLLARQWAAAGLFWLLCLLAAGLNAQTATPQILVPVQASMLVTESSLPPTQSAAWLPVSLPDNWAHRNFQPKPLPVWYRLDFIVPEAFDDQEAWSVYLPYLYDGGEVFLNGQPVAHIAQTTELVHVKWERPHLLALPYGAGSGRGLTAGRNVLHLRLNAPEPGVLLKIPMVNIGPAQALQKIYEQRLFLIRTVAQFTSAACFVAAVFGLFIWWRRRTEVLFGVFGIAVLFWGVRTLTFVIEVLPVAQWNLWRLCYQSATGGFVMMMGIFALRTANVVRPKFERGLAIYALLGPIFLAIGGSTVDPWVSNVWTAGFLLVGPLIMWMVFVAAWRQQTASTIALMLSVIVTVIAAAHDYFLLVSAPWLARLAPEWTAARFFVLAYAANAMLLVMGSVLASRFINALHDLETLNQTLDRRVAEREAVIAQNYQRLAVLEGQRQAAEERQRIMQDMHDGLGAQLFSSLSRVERSAMSQQEMSDALRSCIAEMRLAIDSVSTSEDDFEVMLSDFRYRWEPELKAIGIASKWQVSIAADVPQLAPHNSLQVLRILQEALTNVLKHAQASQVQVRLHWDGERLSAQVEDDGHGFQGTPRAQSRGLNNMRNRAARLGGTVLLERRDARTVLSLTLQTSALAYVATDTANAV